MQADFDVDIRQIIALARRMTEKEVEGCAKQGVRKALAIMRKPVQSYAKSKLPHRLGSSGNPLYKDVKMAVWKRPQGQTVAGGSVSLLAPRGKKGKGNRAYILRFYNAAPTKRGHLHRFTDMNGFFDRQVRSAKKQAEERLEGLVVKEILKKANKDGMI